MLKWAATVTLLYVNILCCSPLWGFPSTGAIFSLLWLHVILQECLLILLLCCTTSVLWVLLWFFFFVFGLLFHIFVGIYLQLLCVFFPLPPVLYSFWQTRLISRGLPSQTIILSCKKKKKIITHTIVSIHGPLINPFPSCKSASLDSVALLFLPFALIFLPGTSLNVSFRI